MAAAKQSVYRRATGQVATVRTDASRARVQAKPPPPFMEWAMRVPEPKAGPLDFERFPFQRELYEETGTLQEVVFKKATQIGISAYLVRETMYWADVSGWTVIYVFPKLGMMYDFADARVRTLIQGSKYLTGRVPKAHVQNKGLRQIGSGFVYYRGSESVEGLDSIDADALALDEYDNLVAANVPIVERRITGSPHGLIRRVGVPSVPGFGLDLLYDESDQRRWHVKCGHCRKWQPIFFHRDGHPDFDLSAYVDQERVLVVCGKCARPLEVGEGEWVPAFPDRSVRGYHASRLIVPAVARNDREMLTGIVKASLSREPYEVQVFHNRDLGEAYAPKEGRLSLEALKAAQRPDLFQLPSFQPDGRLVTAGIDVASTRALNVRVSEYVAKGVKRALFIGLVESFDELESVLKRYGVMMFCIDHLPEGRLARSLCERFPGRGYLVAYAGQGQNLITVNDEKTMITVRRTEAIDAAFQMIREQRNLLPADLPEGYAKHLQANVRYMTKDDLGKVVVGYRSSGADDYAQAEVYDMVAYEAWIFRQELDQLGEGEIVALEDRLEFSRSHLGNPEEFATEQFNPGPGEGGYSAGFGGSAGGETGLGEPGFDSPYEAWGDD